jgi:hypothetical protein
MGPPDSDSSASSGGSGSGWGKAALYAGLGILSGRSPNALQNIGEGSLEGLKLYDAEKSRETQQASLDANRQSEIATRKQNADEAARRDAETASRDAATQSHLSEMAEIAKAHLGMEGANLAETTRNHDLEASRVTYVGNDPNTNLPMLMDRSGKITLGSAPIGLKTSDAAKAATSAANTAEAQRWHDALIQRGYTEDEINLIGKSGPLGTMDTDAALAKARNALGTPGPATPQSSAAPTAQAIPAIPPRPTGVPEGSAYSPSRKAWRTPDGQIVPAGP